MDVLIVDYSQQLFNDALHSYEQAILLDKNSKPFAYWKYCTWSIVTSVMAMESYVTNYLRYLETELVQHDWRLYEKESIRLTKGTKGIFSKLKLVEIITDSTIIDLNDLDWINIQNTIQLRNDLIHYREPSIFNKINDTNAMNSINACKSLIKKFFTSLDIDYTFSAKWIDKTKSEIYDR